MVNHQDDGHCGYLNAYGDNKANYQHDCLNDHLYVNILLEKKLIAQRSN